MTDCTERRRARAGGDRNREGHEGMRKVGTA
jgi:hypothetical protein